MSIRQVYADALATKVKCPKAEIADEGVTDQFGSHTFTTIKSKLICAPATPAGPTTTTTTSSSSTTTRRSP